MADDINIEFTEKAIEQFNQFLARIVDFKPTLCLYKDRNEGEKEDYWGYGAYSPDNLKIIEPELKKQNASLLYKISGMVVAIPQVEKIDELKGKVIDIGKTSLELTDKNNND